MADIRFYQLQMSSGQMALPLLLQKVSDSGIRGSIVVDSSDVHVYSKSLWEGTRPNGFLAHDVNDAASEAPFVIQSTIENVRPVRFFVDRVDSSWVDGADIICYMFHGTDARVLTHARAMWKTWAYGENEHTLSYYQQTNSGSWDKKA